MVYKSFIVNKKPAFNPQKWYYLAGWDTFLNVSHVLKRLDSYDYIKPFLIDGHHGVAVCLDRNGKKDEI